VCFLREKVLPMLIRVEIHCIFAVLERLFTYSLSVTTCPSLGLVSLHHDHELLLVLASNK